MTTYIPTKNYSLKMKEFTNKYFKDIEFYPNLETKGLWLETQYLPYNKCLELKDKLGSLFWDIKED